MFFNESKCQTTATNKTIPPNPQTKAVAKNSFILSTPPKLSDICLNVFSWTKKFFNQINWKIKNLTATPYYESPNKNDQTNNCKQSKTSPTTYIGHCSAMGAFVSTITYFFAAFLAFNHCHRNPSKTFGHLFDCFPMDKEVFQPNKLEN